MLFREIIEIYCENNGKHMNTLCFDIVSELLYVAANDSTGLCKVKTLFYTYFLWKKPKIIFNISRSPCYDNENKTERKLVAHGDYCSIVNCRTKISAIFRGIFGICCDISEYFFLYSTLYRGTLVGKRRFKASIILVLSTSLFCFN
jgi:hypothetical protein